MILPAFAQYILDASHVRAKLTFDLTSPDDRPRHRRQIMHMAYSTGFTLCILNLKSTSTNELNSRKQIVILHLMDRYMSEFSPFFLVN